MSQKTNNCTNKEAEIVKKITASLEYFEAKNNCTKNEAEIHTKRRTSFGHFEAKKQITAQTMRLKMVKN